MKLSYKRTALSSVLLSFLLCACERADEVVVEAKPLTCDSTNYYYECTTATLFDAVQWRKDDQVLAHIKSAEDAIELAKKTYELNVDRKPVTITALELALVQNSQNVLQGLFAALKEHGIEDYSIDHKFLEMIANDWKVDSKDFMAALSILEQYLGKDYLLSYKGDDLINLAIYKNVPTEQIIELLEKGWLQVNSNNIKNLYGFAFKQQDLPLIQELVTGEYSILDLHQNQSFLSSSGNYSESFVKGLIELGVFDKSVMQILGYRPAYSLLKALLEERNSQSFVMLLNEVAPDIFAANDMYGIYLIDSALKTDKDAQQYGMVLDTVMGNPGRIASDSTGFMNSYANVKATNEDEPVQISHINALISAGAKPDVCNWLEASYMGFRQTASVLAEHAIHSRGFCSNYPETTPLIRAIKQGELNVVRLMLNDEELINYSDLANIYPLDHVGMAKGNEQTLIAIAEALIDAGAYSGRYMSALTGAARHGRLELMETLVSKGLPIDGAKSNELTPLMEAVVSEQLAAVSWLIENGASLNSHSAYGLTVKDYVLLAIEDSNDSHTLTEIKKILDEHGALKQCQLAGGDNDCESQIMFR